MKLSKARLVIRFLAFFLIVVFLIAGLNIVLKPKWSTGYKSGSSIRGFYKMPRETIDLLILGSSNVICGVNANEMFERAGVSGWSCGTEAQPLYGSLAWLEETMRFHKLSAVVLDVGDLFEGFNEVSYRKTFDYMRLSVLKTQLLAGYKAFHPEIDLFSYYLPLIQYHDRWYEVNEKDLFYHDIPLRGFYIRRESRGSEIPGIDASDISVADIPKENLDSLIKIIDLCKDNKITLLLISCPSARSTAKEHNAVMKIAEEYGLIFLDFNDVSKWEDIDYSEDMADFQHLNVYGAQKTTEYILNALEDICVLPDRRDDALQIRLAEEYKAVLEKEEEISNGTD